VSGSDSPARRVSNVQSSTFNRQLTASPSYVKEQPANPQLAIANHNSPGGPSGSDHHAGLSRHSFNDGGSLGEGGALSQFS